MKRIIACALVISFLLLLGASLGPRSSASEYPFEIDAKSAILMDADTGTVLYEKNADAALPPASVTKVMTLLLIMEALDEGKVTLEETVTVSENAASMGGSQVYLEAGETMKLEELIKCVVIASANDAALALAEHLMGSEEAFVKRMNERAAELGMENTVFENTNGLDDTVTSHLTSARDIAIMSRELLSHNAILNYTTLWQDSIRDGSFTLTNTNRLIRFYPGATGLKTGSTAKALFCISATAKRDGMHLIAVVMGAPTRDIRNAETKKLLDFGFAQYANYRVEAEELPPILATGGTVNTIGARVLPFSVIVPKGGERRVETRTVLPRSAAAPISEGDALGYREYVLEGKVIGKVDIVATNAVERVSFFDVFRWLCRGMIGIFS